ncbi:hypothetical protein FRC03_010695 [Tulasnella sp. 419]|nr:hypothetical protein FRC03_010695 [Tulasnella sp. 419]
MPCIPWALGLPAHGGVVSGAGCVNSGSWDLFCVNAHLVELDMQGLPLGYQFCSLKCAALSVFPSRCSTGLWLGVAGGWAVNYTRLSSSSVFNIDNGGRWVGE